MYAPTQEGRARARAVCKGRARLFSVGLSLLVSAPLTLVAATTEQPDARTDFSHRTVAQWRSELLPRLHPLPGPSAENRLSHLTRDLLLKHKRVLRELETWWRDNCADHQCEDMERAATARDSGRTFAGTGGLITGLVGLAFGVGAVTWPDVLPHLGIAVDEAQRHAVTSLSLRDSITAHTMPIVLGTISVLFESTAALLGREWLRTRATARVAQQYCLLRELAPRLHDSPSDAETMQRRPPKGLEEQFWALYGDVVEQTCVAEEMISTRRPQS